MALLAESLVEEWLNREGFFTIRGVKHGVGEIDLLAVRRKPSGTVVGWHVEVQASFRPIGYIAKLTDELTLRDGKKIAASSAVARTAKQIETCAKAWVERKFSSASKVSVREKLWPGVNWSFHLVHAVVREEKELAAFRRFDVICHPLQEVLATLSAESKDRFSGSAGGDLAELIHYFHKKSRS